jgi:hypothetical protein
LSKDLYRVQYYNPKKELPFEHHAINEILDGGIFGCNPEDAQQFLGKYIDQILKLKNELPTIVDKLEIADAGVLDFDSLMLTSPKPPLNRENLQEKLKQRLSYYDVDFAAIRRLIYTTNH